ncbi:hypothetical protein [uncultured Methanomethylovorans sp.]|uniref:hypothetical protein n=1 Tax=uncultured Methanomethylovorans sp. TaxID=183759 RepID=UPI002AA87EED|nr:hypothetical protein [uncultured Methanomethylovorans sp.]
MEPVRIDVPHELPDDLEMLVQVDVRGLDVNVYTHGRQIKQLACLCSRTFAKQRLDGVSAFTGTFLIGPLQHILKGQFPGLWIVQPALLAPELEDPVP